MIDQIEEHLGAPPGPALETLSTLSSTRALRDVLLVEDDEEMRHSLSVALQRWGAFVRVAGTRGEALTEIAMTIPEIALIDITLPDGTGYDVAMELRLAGGGYPIIAMISARSGFVDRMTAIGSGSDVFFEKPIDPERVIRGLEDVVSRRRPSGATVLSVEDDPEHVERLHRVLTAAGYEHHNCSTPLELEELLIELEPELVIMDVELSSHVDGFALSRFMRQHDRWSGVPIIFLTASDSDETSLGVRPPGGDDYLIKPFVAEVLLATVATRIDRARALRSLMDRDGLTGLLTRRAFTERAEAVLKAMTRTEEAEASLVLLDLDHFKKINDSYGHLAGDRVLATFAGFLEGRLRQSDVIARYGGEEFVLIINQLDPESTGRLMESILDEFASEGVLIESGRIAVTFSSGVVGLDPVMTVEQALERADEALYEAKRRGRATTVVTDRTG